MRTGSEATKVLLSPTEPLQTYQVGRKSFERQGKTRKVSIRGLMKLIEAQKMDLLEPENFFISVQTPNMLVGTARAHNTIEIRRCAC